MKTTMQNLLALLTAGACWIAAQANAAPSISLEVLDSIIVQGETFDVQVWAHSAQVSGEELIAFAFSATNLPVASYTGFDSGPLFTPVSETNTCVTDLAFPGIDTNDVLLATLRFTAGSAGSGLLTVQGMYDGLDYGLFYFDSGFDITGSVQVIVLPPPAVVYVDDDYSAGNCDGHEWGYDAFAAIQPGVNILASGGTVHVATGSYAGSVTVNKAATLAAGGSLGQVTVNGDLTLASDTTLEIELAGAAPGSGFDQWVVTGNANLAGTLTIALANDFYPAANARSAFVTAAARAGTFVSFHYPSNILGLLEDYAPTEAAVQVVNVRPEIPLITDRTVDEATPLGLMVNATDADTPSQTLTYSLTNSLSGAGVSATGEITWMPTEAQGPMVTNITVCVTDDGTPGLCVSRTFLVEVNEINVAPSSLTLPPNQAFDEQTAFNANATASDTDLPANALEFALVSGPEGLTVSPGGAITWIPSEPQGSNVYTITVRVTDTNPGAVNGEHLSTTNSFELTVNEVNRPPELGMLTDLSVNPGQTLSFTATATDPDVPTNTLTFALLSPPTGATMSPGSGLFNWRPGVALSDTTNTIQVRVEDDGSPFLSDTNSFTVVVKPLSAPVMLTPVSWSTNAFTLSITGPIGPDYFIQASSELVSWTCLSTNTPGVVPFSVTDTNAGTAGCRYYRVLLNP